MSDNTPDLLAALSKLTDRLTALDADREALVRAARASGASWTQIADALDVTKQSAWERYKDIGASA